MRRKKKLQRRDEDEEGEDPAEQVRTHLLGLAGELDLLGFELLDELRVVDRTW